MTADERLEALLNRAGQTISDLPKRYEQEHGMASGAEFAEALILKTLGAAKKQREKLSNE